MPLIELEERWISAASLIEVHDHTHASWIAALFPHCVSKMIERIETQKISLPRQAAKIPNTKTLSMIAPFSKRFGVQRLNKMLHRLEQLTGQQFQLQIVGPAQFSNEELVEFLAEVPDHGSNIVSTDQATGVVILPTIYNLIEDRKWIEKGMATGLPVVSGYDSEFEERILKAFHERKHSVQTDFPMFKTTTSSANH